MSRAITSFFGCITALATPFKGEGIDEDAFASFIEWQIAEGTRGVVPCGTTGEAATLTFAERERLIRIAVEAASGRVPVIAGTGTNCTETTIASTKAAKAAGADAALVVTPYYNKPTQEGLYRHFEAVARAVDLPIILYNVPARTGVDLAPDTIARLAEIPMIIGIKDAATDPERPLKVALAAGNRFVQLSGNDATAVSFNLTGGRGCISVLANVVPQLCAEMQAACRQDDVRRARAIQRWLLPLIQAFERETNPAPVKYALSLMRGWSPQVRLPLVPASQGTRDVIRQALYDLVPSASARQPVRATGRTRA
jgi:4-hydroxy-tetrahydrodipicolinate synthase